MTTPAPGWYPDPHALAPLRWWDGTQWTEQTATPQAPVPDTTPSWLLPVNRPWQAIAAGYVGLVGIVVIVLFPLSIGFGVAGLRAIKRNGGIGKGRCWFGIASGAWNILFWVAALSAAA